MSKFCDCFNQRFNFFFSFKIKFFITFRYQNKYLQCLKYKNQIKIVKNSLHLINYFIFY